MKPGHTELFLSEHQADINIITHNLKLIKQKLQEARQRGHICNVTITVHGHYNNNHLWERFNDILNTLQLDFTIIETATRWKEYNLKEREVK